MTFYAQQRLTSACPVCPGWSEFAGRTGGFVGFVMLWLRYSHMKLTVKVRRQVTYYVSYSNRNHLIKLLPCFVILDRDCHVANSKCLVSHSSRLETSLDPIWASSWDYGIYHICDQRRLRRACTSVQSRQSLCCSHTWSLEVNEGFDQKSDI